MATITKGYSYDDVLLEPQYNEILSRNDVNTTTRITKNYTINIPLIAANMDTICEEKMAISIGRLGGLGILHRYLSIEEQTKQIRNINKERLLSAAAIGIKDYKERVSALAKAGVHIIALDIAHAHTKKAGETITWIKQRYPNIDIIAGNVATTKAAQYLKEKGADAIKVGIGPGSMCTTRIMTGNGIPQLTAIMNCYKATKGTIPICADGGIKYPGDITKAIAAGAETVMSGSLFAGTEETPGKKIKKKKLYYKEYRGMASYDATIKKLRLNKETTKRIHIEGEKTITPYKGSIKPIIEKYIAGLASGMTYQGTTTIKELVAKGRFIEQTTKGNEESHARTTKHVR